MTSKRLQNLIKFFEQEKYEVHDFLDWGNDVGPYPSFKSVLFPSGEEIINKMSHESFKRANGLYPPNYFNKSVENKDQAAEAKKLSMR